jgi:hypothetical protein
MDIRFPGHDLGKVEGSYKLTTVCSPAFGWPIGRTSLERLNVRIWHKADIPIVLNHVRFWGKADITRTWADVCF